MPNGLTGKQQAFCNHYIISLNATNAAIKAGYSVKCAGIQGHLNLRKAKVLHGIDLAMVERRERMKIDQAWVVEQVMDLLERSKAEDDRTTERYCLDMIAKHTALYSTDVTIHHVYDDMDEKELDLAIKQAELDIAAVH